MYYVILISVVLVALFLIFRDDYEDFHEDDVVCPFVGEIELDGRGWLKVLSLSGTKLKMVSKLNDKLRTKRQGGNNHWGE